MKKIDKKDIVFTNDGSPTMDMIYGEDVGKMNVLAMINKECYRNKSFEGFINVGTGIQTSVMELCRTIKYLLEFAGFDCSSSKIILPEKGNENFENHNFVNWRQANIDLMKEMLGYYDYDVKNGLSKTIQSILRERNLV